MKDPADQVTGELPIIDPSMIPTNEPTFATYHREPVTMAEALRGAEAGAAFLRTIPGMAGAPGPVVDLTKVDLKEVALSRFGEWRTGAIALVRKYDGVAFDCKTTKGMAEAVAARMEVRAPRYAAQRVAKESKSELAAVSKAIGAEEAAVIETLAKTEEHIDRQIRAEEERKAAEKAARERAEQERVARHLAGIATVRSYLAAAQGLTPDRIRGGIKALNEMVFTPEGQEEFANDYAIARDQTLGAMTELLEATLAREAADLLAAKQRQELEDERLAIAEQTRRLEEERAAVAKQLAEITAIRAEIDAARNADLERARAEAIRIETLARRAAEEKVAAETALAIKVGAASEDVAQILSPPADKPAFVPQPTPIPLARPKITLSIISQRLGFLVTQALLHDLGFDPAEKVKTSVLYAEESFVAICEKLVDHIHAVAREHS